MKIVIQAIVQGLTEFLPVSSSGHLIALETFFIPDPAAVATMTETTVALHAGTLLAVLLVFWKSLVELCGHRRSLVIPLVVATIPAACVGLLIVISGLEELLTDPRLTGAMLVVTGFVLWMGEPSVASGDETANIETLSNRQAFWIGIAQAFAIVPGLSRSGLTIVVARRIGLPGQQAAQFSFLMSIPVIAGAVVVMLWQKTFEFSNCRIDRYRVECSRAWNCCFSGSGLLSVTGIVSGIGKRAIPLVHILVHTARSFSTGFCVLQVSFKRAFRPGGTCYYVPHLA